MTYADHLPYRVNHWWNIILTYNKGAAFSLGFSWLHANLFFLMCGCLGGCYLFLKGLALLKTPRYHQVPWMMVSAGAWGNVYDRLRYGFVIDWCQWHYHQWYWPTFNFADMWICLGVMSLLMIKNDEKKSRNEAHAC